MNLTKIAAIFADSERLGGQTVTIGGWARTIRDMKTFGFIELNDGSCFKNLQVVMSAEELDNYKEIAGQNVGAALIVMIKRGGRAMIPNGDFVLLEGDKVIMYTQMHMSHAQKIEI